MDDDAAQLETLSRGLVYVGLACLSARTAAEAERLLAERRVSLLLVDLSAPGKPGARLIAQVRRARPALPVLVVTGLAPSSNVIALEDEGVPILKKPFTPDQLGRAIEAAMAGSTDDDDDDDDDHSDDPTKEQKET